MNFVAGVLMSRPKPVQVRSFASSNAKDYLRHVLDRQIIADFKDRHYPDQKLSYLGLPGPELLDVLSWREFIGDCTAIEDTDAFEDLELNVLRNRLTGIVRVVRDGIDDLLLTDSPCLHWPHHIVNLDYTGGLAHRERRDRPLRRVDAIKRLLMQQSSTAFLLLLTVNLRNKDFGELEDLVQEVKDDLLALDFEGVEECFSKHVELGYVGLLKIYVPIFLDNNAIEHTLVFYPPILYQGTKQMMHFIVECVPYTKLEAGRVSKTTQRIELINLPLFTLHSYDSLKKIELGLISYRP